MPDDNMKIEGKKEDSSGILYLIAIGILVVLVIAFIAGVFAIMGYFRGSMSGSGWLTGPASSLSYPADADPAQVGNCLDEYMKSVVPSSPLIGHGIDFATSGQSYNVNPALMVAIGQQESQLGTVGIVRDHPHNYYGLTKPGGGWAEFSSWEEAINNQARYLREEYLDKGLTTIPQIGSKYAPVGAANDPNNLNSNWVKGVQAKFDAIITHCPDLKQEAPLLAGACSVGYQGQPASCGWIEVPDSPDDYSKSGGSGEHWGKPEFVNMVMAVAKSWREAGNPKLRIGELSGKCVQASGHKSHGQGIDADIDIPGRLIADSGNSPDLTTALAKKFISCGVTTILYNDVGVQNQVNAWARQSGYSGRMCSETGHENHFHIRAGSYWCGR